MASRGSHERLDAVVALLSCLRPGSAPAGETWAHRARAGDLSSASSVPLEDGTVSCVTGRSHRRARPVGLGPGARRMRVVSTAGRHGAARLLERPRPLHRRALRGRCAPAGGGAERGLPGHARLARVHHRRRPGLPSTEHRRAAEASGIAGLSAHPDDRRVDVPGGRRADLRPEGARRRAGRRAAAAEDGSGGGGAGPGGRPARSARGEALRRDLARGKQDRR